MLLLRVMKNRAVTMLELVFAMGLLFVAAGGVMTILMAGAGYPRRTQYVVVRDGLVKAKLDELVSSATPPTFSGGYNPYPGNPDYEFRVDTDVTDFDPNSSWIKVTVRGPKPYKVESSLHGMFVKPNGAALFAAYDCNTCHVAGSGTPSTGPNLNLNSVQLGMSQRNAGPGPDLDVDQYIRESVRTPDAFLVPGYDDALMTAYPNINDMPNEDLQALTAYIKSF